MKPTIDEAITWINSVKTSLVWIKNHGLNVCAGDGAYEEKADLVIQALTEMRDRENLYNALPNSIPKTREELAMYLKSLGLDPTKVIDRTWRDVTAGEIRDFLVINPRFSWHRIQQPAEAVLKLKQPDLLKSWRSMGA